MNPNVQARRISVLWHYNQSSESRPLLDQMIEALPQKQRERTTRIKEIIPKLQAILGVILRFIV